MKFRFDWDWPGAELEFRRALELNPGYATARQRYAIFLGTRRRFDEALAQIAHARALDPMSPAVHSADGRILYFSGRFDEAAAIFRRILHVDPAFVSARMDLAVLWVTQRNWAEARAELGRTALITGETAAIVFLRACCAHHEGRRAEVRNAQAVLQELYTQGLASADELALMALWFGENDRAVQLLEEALRRRAPLLAYVEVEFIMRALLDEPRCRALLQAHELVSEV